MRETRSSARPFELHADQPATQRRAYTLLDRMERWLERPCITVIGMLKRAIAFLRIHLWLWVSLFLYFTAYVPYSMQSKRISDHVTTLQILPLTSLGGFTVTVIEFIAIGLVITHGRGAPLKARLAAFWQRLSFSAAAVLTGVACAVISMMTTASYMLHGAALVTMGLLLRGGMLSLAPINDKLQHRHISAQTWVGFSLAIAAIACSLVSAGAIPLVGIGIFIAYECAYALNLNFYGKNQGKFEFLCSAQFIACTTMVMISVAQCTVMWTNDGVRAAIVHAGSHGTGLLSITIIDALNALSIGALAQLTGIFGPMILMSPTEQTYSVPINRSGSVIATVAAQRLLGNTLSIAQLLGVTFFIIAIVVLALRPRVQRQPNCDIIITDGEDRNTIAALCRQAA